MDTDERNILANKRNEKKIFKHKTNKQFMVSKIYKKRLKMEAVSEQ